MFKYIKKLTSVVVMFAIIIVFSSSNVYAQEYKQNYNPAHIFFSFAIPLQMGIVSLSLKTLGEDFDVRWEEKNKEKNIPINTPYRKGKIQLKQKDMREYFDCMWNDDTKKFELTEKGKKDFEKSKDKGGDGGSEGGGHM